MEEGLGSGLLEIEALKKKKGLYPNRDNPFEILKSPDESVSIPLIISGG
jgi:hypothetical protein